MTVRSWRRDALYFVKMSLLRNYRGGSQEKIGELRLKYNFCRPWAWFGKPLLTKCTTKALSALRETAPTQSMPMARLDRSNKYYNSPLHGLETPTHRHQALHSPSPSP